MLYAVDRNDNKVSIEEAVSRGDYFCPCCGKPVLMRKGEVRAHHFAHSPKHPCSDNWNTQSGDSSYDDSGWHNEWQSLYPKENVEIIVGTGDIKHRADVMIGNTVIEFQHSPISSAHFQERSNFYLNQGMKVIWLFDFRAEFKEGKVGFINDYYTWIRPHSTFRDVTEIEENMDIFYQISDDSECIIRVNNVSQYGFEIFKGTDAITKQAFLEYTGFKNGECVLPNIKTAEENDKQFLSFIKAYNIQLDRQQQRAVQSIEGANLVLSVPGSGKTTVLTNRIAYMVLCKGIKPDNILAITFTNAAADEMKSRLRKNFRSTVFESVRTSTINSLALNIVNRKTRGDFTTAGSKGRTIVVELLKEYKLPYYIDNIKLYESAIAFIKSKLNQKEYMDYVIHTKQLDPRFRSFFNDYNDRLHAQKLIDFHDQNNLALQYLKEDPELLKSYQNQFQYVCVDEAQDTNQVQYELIRLIASSNNNIFMVGDEDQSIYGFNGSYPEALLNFRDVYTNPFILKLERNYRSTSQIVDIARDFIDKNIKRNKKDMYAVRSGGKAVSIIEVGGFKEQAEKLAEIAEFDHSDMAILYRENNTCVVLINQLIKHNVPFQFTKDDIDVFSTSNVRKVIAYLRFVINNRDFKSFYEIDNTISFEIWRKATRIAVDQVIHGQFDNVFDALAEYIENNPFKNREINISRVLAYKREIEDAKIAQIDQAIVIACRNVIFNFAQQQKIKDFFIALAEPNDTISDYLSRLMYLENIIKSGNSNRNGVTLSTFHSAKGLEFEKVYLADVYDGVIPSVQSMDNRTEYEEERRLFYVAITRAKNELYLMKIAGKDSEFIDELFPEKEKEYSVHYLDAESGKDLLPPKKCKIQFGETIIEKAEDVFGYKCKNNAQSIQYISNSDYEPTVIFTYDPRTVVIHFKSNNGGEISKTSTIISYRRKDLSGCVASPNNGFHFVGWYADPDYLHCLTKNTEITDFNDISCLIDGGTDSITIYAKFDPIENQTLLEIGDEVRFRKVLIVENNQGRTERITTNIWSMYDKYGKVYGDNGEIKDFDEPIWKVISKL